jgi:hypothetical protein
MQKNGFTSSGSNLFDTKHLLRGSYENEVTQDMKLTIFKDEFFS